MYLIFFTNFIQVVEITDKGYIDGPKSSQFKKSIFMEEDKRGERVTRHQELDNDKQTTNHLTVMEVRDFDEDFNG